MVSSEEITKQLEKQGLGFTVCTSCGEVLVIEAGSAATAPGLPPGLLSASAADVRRCSQDGAPLLKCPPVGDILVGDYQFLSLIGVGGMGGVFKCRHRLLDKTVAVKRLLVESVSEREKLRFKQEAQVLSKLQHKNLVTVYDFGFDGAGLPYLAMEYVEGQTLSQMLKMRRLSLDESLSIFEQCVAGLECAHRAGIIHRDIKPGNLILTGAYPYLSLKILDFGIAKASTGARGQEGQSLTSTGEVFGSPLYMSPEQALGRAVDERSDLYSLGCVLFEMLFGAPPFRGANAMETIFKHVNEVPVIPSVTTGDVNVGMRLTGLLAALLSKEASLRPVSAQACRLEVEAIRSLGPAIDSALTDGSYAGGVPSENTERVAATGLATMAKPAAGKLVLIALVLIFLVGIILLVVLGPRTGAPGAGGQAKGATAGTSDGGSRGEASGVNYDPTGSSDSLAALHTGDRTQVLRLIEQYRSQGSKDYLKFSDLVILPEGIDELKRSGADIANIEVKGCSWKDKNVVEKLSSCRLHSLTLRYLDDLTDDQFRKLCQARGLQDVTLQNCPRITSRGLLGFRELKSPGYFEISQLGFSQTDLNNILPVEGLRGLIIEPEKRNLGPGWLDALSQCKSLHWLRIRKVDISSYPLWKLGQLPELQSLALNGCNGISPDSFRQLRLLHSLREVYLGESDARADSVKTLLVNCPKIKVYFKGFVPDSSDHYLNEAVKSGRLQLK